jgi:hypothetical protein
MPIHPDSINFAYGKFLSEKLKCNYINIACSGISNFEISRNIQQYIMNTKLDFSSILVVIGWTDPNRFTFYPSKICEIVETLFFGKEFPYNFSAYSIDYAKAYPQAMKFLKIIKSLKHGDEFLLFFRKNIFKTNYFYDLNYIQRLYTSSFLKGLNIKHITFSTLKEKPYKNTFKYEKLLSNKNNILENKDKFDYYDMFKEYGVYRGGHLKIEAHKAFSNFLFNTIIERGVL